MVCLIERLAAVIEKAAIHRVLTFDEKCVNIAKPRHPKSATRTRQSLFILREPVAAYTCMPRVVEHFYGSGELCAELQYKIAFSMQR
jgi:hypothetical protein